MRYLSRGIWPVVWRDLGITSLVFLGLAAGGNLVVRSGLPLAGPQVPLDHGAAALAALALLYGFSGLSLLGIGVGLTVRWRSRAWGRPEQPRPWAERVALAGGLLEGGLYQAGSLVPDEATPAFTALMLYVLGLTLGLWWYFTRQARRLPDPPPLSRPTIPWTWRMGLLSLALVVTWSTSLIWLLPLAGPQALSPPRQADWRRGTALTGLDLCLVAALQSTTAQRRADLRRRRAGGDPDPG
jgi:hypothetical protein